MLMLAAGFLEMHCISVLAVLIFNPNLLLDSCNRSTWVWRSLSFSVISEMSSAKRRLLHLVPDIVAPRLTLSSPKAMTTSSIMLNSRGESTQPCKTPTRVSNQLDNSPAEPTRTELRVDLYRFSSNLTIFLSYPRWRITCHSPRLQTLSNAFWKST